MDAIAFSFSRRVAPLSNKATERYKLVVPLGTSRALRTGRPCHFPASPSLGSPRKPVTQGIPACPWTRARVKSTLLISIRPSRGLAISLMPVPDCCSRSDSMVVTGVAPLLVPPGCQSTGGTRGSWWCRSMTWASPGLETPQGECLTLKGVRPVKADTSPQHGIPPAGGFIFGGMPEGLESSPRRHSGRSARADRSCRCACLTRSRRRG